MKLEPVAKPEGYEGAYKFFRNEDTGQLWKVKLELRQARDPLVEAAVALAPGEYSVIVTVAPAEIDGKAVTEDDKPIVIDSHTHTFNSVEMSAEDFDPQARIMAIVGERVEAGEARLVGINSVRNFVEGWN